MNSRSREIADVLAHELAAQPAGAKVATEHEVGQRFGVGRAAARAALQELERRMIVRRVQGLGSFTSKRVDYLISPDHPPSWSRTVRAAGSTPRTVVLSCDLVPMPAVVAERLAGAEGDPGFLLRRRSFTDGLPASWGSEWLPRDLVPELPTAVRVEESLDRIVRDMGGVDPVRSWVRAMVEYASPTVAEGLGCRSGDQVWLVESVNSDSGTGRPVMFTERWIRADAIRVVFETGHLRDPSGND